MCGRSVRLPLCLPLCVRDPLHAPLPLPLSRKRCRLSTHGKVKVVVHPVGVSQSGGPLGRGEGVGPAVATALKAEHLRG